MKVISIVALSLLISFDPVLLAADLFSDKKLPTLGVSLAPSSTGLKLTNDSKLPLLMRKNEGPVCSNFDIFNSLSPVNRLNFNWNRVNNKFSEESCFNARIYLNSGRYNISRCTDAYLCSMKKLSEISDSKKRDEATSLLRNASAKEFAANMLKSKTQDMENFELLKRFAAKKFNTKPDEKCQSLFQIKSPDQCQLGILETGFKEYQAKCKADQVGCYTYHTSKKTVTYGDYEKSFKENGKSPLVSFFEKRTDTLANRFVENDNQYMERLTNFITSEKFVKASSAEKEELFIEELKSQDQHKFYQFRDPIIAFDFNLNDKGSKSFRDHPQYKKLKEIILTKNLSKEGFIQKFDNYRKNRAGEILGKNGSCQKATSLQSICHATTSINKGQRLYDNVDSMALAQIMSDKHYEEEGEEYKTIKGIIGDSLKDEIDFDMFLDAQRCIAINRVNLSDDKRDDSNDPDYNSPFTDAGTIPATKLSRTNSLGMEDLVSFSKNEEAPEYAIVRESDEGNPLDSIAEDSQAQESYFGNNQFDHQNNGFNNTFNSFINNEDDEDEKNKVKPEEKIEEKKEEVVARNDISTANDSKIQDLMKKLSATEEKLEKLKSSTEAAEEARVREKKIQEENALISELKSQINELKTANKTRAAQVNQASAQRNDYNSTQTNYQPSFGGGASISRSQEKQHNISNDIVEPVRAKESNTSGSGSSGGSASRSIASTPTLSSSSSDNGSTDNSSGLVLTQVEGMSVEKATETIANKILELNGMPFLIKEDGVFKKVVPVIANGKIAFDENGKPKFKKIDCGETKVKCEEKDRKPAFVAVADEKRSEEDKTKRELERAQYRKFLEASQKAMQKKK